MTHERQRLETHEQRGLKLVRRAHAIEQALAELSREVAEREGRMSERAEGASMSYLFWLVLTGLALMLLGIVYTRPAKRTQGTYIWCECGNELCSSRSFISDTYDERGDNHVKYKCSKCGKESDYNFDVAPIPISWKELAPKDESAEGGV